MKELKKLTIEEFNMFIELLKEDPVDLISIVQLFGYNVDDLTINDFNIIQTKIHNYSIPKKTIQKYYLINGRRFKVCLDLTKIIAGQFIDFQNIKDKSNLEECLSIFLIPQKKVLLGWKDNKYNDGYDILEIKKFLLKNMLIEDAKALTDFFLFQSTNLLKVMEDCFNRKMMMMKKKQLKNQTI